MVRKRTTLVVRGEDFALESFTDEEKGNLLTLVHGEPLVLNLYLLRELMRIRKRAGFEQWVQKYEYRLDSAKSNLLIDQFPTHGSKFLLVHSCSGVVALNFDSQNEPVWTLAARDLYQLPFESIYLTWAAQPNKCLIFYLSNKEILRTTLA